MSPLIVALIVSAAPTQEAGLRTREVPVAATAKDGTPALELKAEEIEIKEDGKKRTVLGVRPDERPVDVAVILDSSEWMGDEYRTTLVPAAMDFWRSLPAEARVTVWTCGGKVDQVVPFGTDPQAAETTLQSQAIGGPAFPLDAIVEASRDLQKGGRERRVVVVVTSSSIQFTRTLIQRTYQAVPEARVRPVVILVKGAAASGGGVRVGGETQSGDVESVFEQMTEGYGGGYDMVLTIQAVGRMLSRAAGDIAGQHLVRFESASDKPTRPEVKVKRKGVRVRAGLAQIAR